jgi:hypothetical protein
MSLEWTQGSVYESLWRHTNGPHVRLPRECSKLVMW